MKSSEIAVPVAALALPGASGDVSPAVGDEVDISGTAAVVRIEGDKAVLTIKTINGETIAAMPNKKPESLEDEEAEMRAEAGTTDRLY